MSSMNKNRSLVLGVMLRSILYVVLQLIIPISANHSPYAHKKNIIYYDCSDSTPATTRSSKTAFTEDSNLTTVLRDSIKDSMGDPKDPETYPCMIKLQFNYTFTVITGGYNFIRLHFRPNSYRALNMSKALFSVTVGPYTLLTTSESSYSSDALDVEDIVKEYCINVDGLVLNITVTPSRNSTGTFGFVDMIQIVSMPPNLYVSGDSPLPILSHGQSLSKFLIRNSTALETMYRVNVGGPSISAEDDKGMFRVWSEDTLYLIGDSKDTAIVDTKEARINYSSSPVPVHTTPAKVYATARTSEGYGNSSLTWCFPLDSGFYYLIRLHFCNIARHVIGGKWVFQVYINNQTAGNHADVTQWGGDSACCVPMYRDYVVNCSSSLTLQLVAVGYNGAILNGLEIFKLSDDSNNLSGLYPFRSRKKPFEKSNDFLENHGRLLASILLGFLFSLVVLALVCYPFLHFRQGWCRLVMLRLVPSKWKRRAFMQLGASSADHCRYFSLAEINSATNNFSESNIIGAGGFGKVYQGQIDDSGPTRNVAIKRLSPTSNQGFHEFQTEITTLPKLRHCHLVSLIGFCMDEKEMILVYDFMARGTLRDHLYNTRKPPLPWKQRLEICIGAARGLHYLHAGTNQKIIHRDVKSTNILLDRRWVAKVADFGLSKAGPAMLSCTHISTAVKGSFGYLDPEYYRRQKLTEKSDVYSFGVVLFEVLCARPAVLPMVEPEEEEEEEEEWRQKVNLADWALHCHRTGSLNQIIDPYLMGKIGPECFKTFTEIATKCLADRGCDRPLMSDVLWNLELALLQQEGGDGAEERLRGETNKRIIVGQVAVKIDGHPVLWVGNSDPTPGAEFSEIMAPSGR